MPLTEFQKASFRSHLHNSDQVIDPDTGEPIEPGGDTSALEADIDELKMGSVQVVIDGGGSEIADATKVWVRVPFACTLTAARALADVSGSIVVDVWKDTYANYPPTDADSITASAPVTISSTTKSEDSTLTGWTTSVAAGDILLFNVDSCTTITKATIELAVTRT